MQSPSPLPPVQQFILDCAELASNLDSLDTGDQRAALLAGILSGQTEYHALLLRRNTLSPSSAEEAWVDFMIDCLVSRLKFLGSRAGISELCIGKPPSLRDAARYSC